MFPSEAIMNSYTYQKNVMYKKIVFVEQITYSDNTTKETIIGKFPQDDTQQENVLIQLPIMVGSKHCVSQNGF